MKTLVKKAVGIGLISLLLAFADQAFAEGTSRGQVIGYPWSVAGNKNALEYEIVPSFYLVHPAELNLYSAILEERRSPAAVETINELVLLPVFDAMPLRVTAMDFSFGEFNR